MSRLRLGVGCECGEGGGRGVWSWSPEGVRLIPESALEGCVMGVLMPALYSVLMREVGARALWWCRREAGYRGCRVEDVCGESGFLADRRQGVLN